MKSLCHTKIVSAPSLALSWKTVQFNLVTTPLEKLACDVLVAGVFEGAQQLSGAAKTINVTTHGLIESMRGIGDITGKVGTATPAMYNQGTLPAKRIIVVGLVQYICG